MKTISLNNQPSDRDALGYPHIYKIEHKPTLNFAAPQTIRARIVHPPIDTDVDEFEYADGVYKATAVHALREAKGVFEGDRPMYYDVTLTLIGRFKIIEGKHERV